jgi:alkylation response protein AidB-like acyl-CoA dehydrogenase
MSTQWQMPEDATLRAFLEQIRKYSKKELLSQYATSEKNGQFPDKAVKSLVEMGVFGLIIPVEYGGSGMGAVAAAYVARELAYWWPGLHLIWTAHNLAVEVIIQSGSEEQRKRLLPLLASGEMGAFCLTEPGAGTDALLMSTRAMFESDDGCYVLHGSKDFITNAKEASVLVIPARTGPGKKDISAFLLEVIPGAAVEGLTIIPQVKNILKCASFCRIELNGVSVPTSALLGKLGEGFHAFMHSLAYGRIGIAAQAIGMAERIFYEAMKHARDRKMFGGTLWDKQVTKHAFAKARAELWVAWQGVVEAARLCDSGEDFNEEASCVKYIATEAADEVARMLTRQFGGGIALTIFDHMQRMNEAYLTTIYEGCNEVQLDIIARYLEKEFKG